MSTCQHLLSENASNLIQMNLSVDLSILNSLLFGYFLLAICTRKPAFLLAFLLCVFLQSASVMSLIDESVVYLLITLVYSYVYGVCAKNKSKLACLGIIFLSFGLYVDAALYGITGIYGTFETFVFTMSEYFSLLAHSVFICSFIDLSKIRNCLQRIAGFVTRVSSGIYYSIAI